jgi:hypothetical protein
MSKSIRVIHGSLNIHINKDFIKSCKTVNECFESVTRGRKLKEQEAATLKEAIKDVWEEGKPKKSKVAPPQTTEQKVPYNVPVPQKEPTEVNVNN